MSAEEENMSLARRRSIAFLGALTIVLAACSGGGASPTASEAEPGESTVPSAAASGDATGDCNITANADGQLEPLEDGFPNQPFTIINIDDAGAPDGIYALAIKDSIERNNLTDQRVTVIDRPDFGTYGTWEALGFMSSEPGGDDGYIMAVQTVPGSTTDLLTTQVIDDLGVSIESTNVVLTTEYVPYAMVATKDADWGSTFEELIAYTQEHPGELKYISRGPGSGLDLAFNNYSQVAAEQAGLPEGDPGIPAEVVIGGSHQEINAVVGSGEGDFAMTLADVAKQFYDDGRVEVILYSGNAPAPAPFEDIPTARDYFGDELLPSDPWGQNRDLFVTEAVPECHHAWLVELITQAVADEEFIASREQVPGLTLQNLSREETFELAETAFDAACEILKPADLLDPSMADAC
jgi:tripartite-type tricarboxylate transporter receptor subunit TctC